MVSLQKTATSKPARGVLWNHPNHPCIRACEPAKMTRESTIVSLQELCFTHIVMTLEEYADKELTLLPKRFRKQLLHCIPVVDVCRLEATPFISEIDTSSLWEQVYKEYIGANSEVSTDWKINFFTVLTNSILGDKYSQNHNGGHMDLKNKVTCLLAMKCETGSGVVKTVLRRHHAPRSYYNMPKQTPQQKLLIPARHEKYFLENDQIPDSTALEIICQKCLFHPKEISVSMNTFSQLLVSQKYNLDIWAAFFEELEVLTIWDERWKSIADFRADSTPLKETPSELLGLVLRHNKGRLQALRIKVSRMISYGAEHYNMLVDDTKEVASLQIDDPIDSIAPILSSSYNRLRQFTLDATGIVSPALEKLISITEHQTELDTISITVSRCSQRMGWHRNSPLIWYTPQFSAELLQSWIHSCLQKPSLRHFTLCLSPISTELFVETLVTFLSTCTSSTHEQTLTFN